MTEALVQLFGSIEPHWRVLIFAMLPVTELRASLPLGVIWGLTPGESLWWSLSGNFLPIIPLLLFLPWFFRIMARWKPLARPLHDLANHQLRKGDQV
ncbi:MAG: small multi-drug export protein, partial [Clostridiales bacterium]